MPRLVVLRDVEDVLVDVEVLLLDVEFLLDVVECLWSQRRVWWHCWRMCWWMWRCDVLVDPVPSVVALLEGVLVDVEVLPLEVEFLLDVGDVLVE